jgi:hypothetical protein
VPALLAKMVELAWMVQGNSNVCVWTVLEENTVRMILMTAHPILAKTELLAMTT